MGRYIAVERTIIEQYFAKEYLRLVEGRGYKLCLSTNLYI